MRYWSKVFAEAGVNGVSAICYKAVKGLPADRQPDFGPLLRRHPDILREWEPKLRQVGLYRFSRVMLCATDQLLGTGFHNGWDSHTQRRARRFTYLFLTESNPYVRYFAKFTFLPLRPSEILRIWYEKARTLLHKQNI